MSQRQQKRKSATADELTGREKKKVRIAEARTIPVQSVGSSSKAGPSKVVPINSIVGLPSAIDVEKIVESRAFEIDAMQTAMKTASSSSTQRAWQALPRHLRRRAASHDVRRVPQRLRGRASAEMDASAAKKMNLPKRGKAKQETRTESFLRRQKDKSWLETHIWHAKRMHMDDMWGYRLALQPTEKSYRASHRASVKGSIIHDASYYSLVELKGGSEIIVGLLALCCDPQDPKPGAARFLNGSRTQETHIYEPGSYPFGLIAPISIIWRPTDKELNVPKSLDSHPMRERSTWLRFHPNVHQQVLSALEVAASQYIAKQKAEGVESIKVEICDLKDQINVFEVMGPLASQVIRGALSVAPGDQREEFKNFWSLMANIETSGAIPRNIVIGFKVIDPRLRFPPKIATPKPWGQKVRNDVFPSVSLSKSDLWDESIRMGLSKPKYTKKELDERRAQNLIPGTPLNPKRQDDRVPVLLIQRSLVASKSTGGHPIHGWILVVPSGWGMAFWSSLVFTGTRVAGQRERQTQAYESGTAYFPRDYPFTMAYQHFSDEREEKFRDDWERKPPAKRTNFENLRVDDPWTPNWQRILGIQSAEDPESLVPTQREPVSDNIIQPWLLRGTETAKIIERLASTHAQGDTLAHELDRLRTSRGMNPLANNIQGQALLQRGVVIVKVEMYKRGLPRDMALIYSMDDEEVPRVVNAHKGGGTEDTDNECEEMLAESALIGRVTTGNFSLTIGNGYAVGAVSLEKWLQIINQPAFEKRIAERPYVKIRNTDSNQYRLARLGLLIEGDN